MLYRHELKYQISEREADLVRRRLSECMEIDRHAAGGSYLIRSLYFDDIWDSAYRDKQAGTVSRKKYRIRIYNNSDDHISLECKSKRGSYILKRSALIDRDELFRILKGDHGFLLEREEEVLREFYTACVSEGLRPSVIVDYDRTPFVYGPGTVRITFDEHVRAGFLSFDLFDSTIPMFETFEPGKLIMEVKYTEYLPEEIRDLLEPASSIQMSASKFVLCSDRMRDIRGLERIV